MITIVTTVYCTLTYVVGWNFFKPGDLDLGCLLAWALSPITVPAVVVLACLLG